MGSIVSFTPKGSRSSSRASATSEAAIIIFPGVRYERTPEPDAKAEAIAASAPTTPTH